MVIKDVFPSVYRALSYHDITCHRSIDAILCINGYACMLQVVSQLRLDLQKVYTH